MGIEPTALAWEARVLPLYDVREGRNSTLDFTVQQIQPWSEGNRQRGSGQNNWQLQRPRQFWRRQNKASF
jgi:hypothetical protein